MYGLFAAATADQSVTINGDLIVLEALTLTQLIVEDTTVDTAASYEGIYNRHIKTDGATGAGDDFFGSYFITGMNQAGGEVRYLDGIVNELNFVAGEAFDLDVFYSEINADGGTVGNNIYGGHIVLDIEAAVTVSGDIYGHFIEVDTATDPTGDVFGLYLHEIAGVDYGFYQDGTAPNVFGGPIELAGSAKTYNAMWVDAGGIRAPGSKPATLIAHGTLETPAWSFAKQALAANQEIVSFNIRIPERMDRSIAPILYLGWSATGANPGDCEWQLEYLWRADNEDTSAAAQETLPVTATASATSEGLVSTAIPGINIPSDIDVCMHCRLTRLSADANDTIAVAVELHGICLRWTSDKLGGAT